MLVVGITLWHVKSWDQRMKVVRECYGRMGDKRKDMGLRKAMAYPLMGSKRNLDFSPNPCMHQAWSHSHHYTIE